MPDAPDDEHSTLAVVRAMLGEIRAELTGYREVTHSEISAVRDQITAQSSVAAAEWKRVDDKLSAMESTMAASASALSKANSDGRAEIERQMHEVLRQIAATNAEVTRVQVSAEKRLTDTREEIAKDTTRRQWVTTAISAVVASIPLIIIVAQGSSR